MQYLLRHKIKHLIVLILLLPAAGYAQFLRDGLNQENHDDKDFHFGIHLGANRSHYNIQHSPRFLQFDSINIIESVNSTGINLAWLVNLRLSQHFDLRTYPVNLVFTEKAFEYTLKTPDKPRGEDTLTVKKVQGITLSLPVQLKFSSDRIANLKVFMMAGARVDYDLAANSGKKINDDVLTLHKLDYGLEGGIGFHIYFPVFVMTPELKVTYGLRNVLDQNKAIKFSNTIDRLSSRSLTLSLTIE